MSYPFLNKVATGSALPVDDGFTAI